MKEDTYEVKEANWEKINNDKYGQIKFRKKKNSSKRFFKLIIFIFIAMLSGAISSNYIVEKKYSKIVEVNNQKFNIEDHKLKNQVQNEEYSNITRVAETIGPTVVGIMIKPEGSSHNEKQINSSGVIFDSNGYIVTNYYVVQGKNEIAVKLPNGQSYLKAELIGIDVLSNLAVIKIEAKNLPIAKFGDSSKLRVGDIAIAIGNPLGEESVGIVTSGIISARNKKIQLKDTKCKILQTNASINQDNNGGALCNKEGEVIGINSLKLGDQNFKVIEGIGSAIAINEVKTILDKIMKP